MNQKGVTLVDRTRQAASVATFGFVLWLNGLAGAGTLSGDSIGVIANRYVSAFLPADYVFGIWGVIYLALFGFTLYQALPGQGANPLLRRLGWWWPVNGVLNVAWIVTFSFSRFGAAMIIMLLLLASLLAIHVEIGIEDERSLGDRLFVALPFNTYLSWIFVAVVANTFQYVSSLGWDGLDTVALVASALMMIVTTGLGAFMAWRRRAWVTPLVVAWALAGIAARYSETPLLALTGWSMVGVGIVSLVMSRWGAAARRGATVASALMLFSAVSVAGQEAELRGRVFDGANMRPVQGALVTVVETGAQTLTADDGRFGIDRLPPGLVSVVVEMIGYRSERRAEVVLQASRSTYVEFRLERRAIVLEGIVVGAPAFRVPAAAPTSVQRLSNEELRRTPGGFLDISRTLLSLPGVLGGVDNRNDLLVRGGGPGENAYYLDGIRVPQINHFATQGASGGALGLVNVDFIREAEFFSGAFPVRYGDALSSVLSIENRPGSPEGVRGDFTLGATEAALTLDGPAGQNGNWLFSVRRSYLKFLFAAIGLPIRPDYWDAQFRVELEPTTKDRVLFVGLGAVDNFGIVAPAPGDDYENFEIFERVIDNDQRSYTLGASWRRLISGGFLTTTLSHSTSDYDFKDPGADGFPVLSNESLENDSRLSGRADLALGDRLTFDGGVDVTQISLDVALFQRAVPGGSLPTDLAWNRRTSLWKVAAYAQFTGDVWSRTSLSVGARADEVTALDRGLSVSPRGSLKVQVTNDVSLQIAAGVFHQSPSLLSLSVEEAGRPANLGLRQQRNVQAAGGVSWVATPGLRVSAEAFVKEYDRVPLLRDDPRIALSNLGGDYGFVGAEPLTDEGTGRARGMELLVQQKLLQKVYLLGAYTLSWSEFAGLDGVLRASAWDRRHAMDLTAGLRPSGSWEFGTKLRWLSGLATTPWDVEASAASYAITGRGTPDWSRIGEIRTPSYVRLDVRAERRLSYSGWNGVVYLDVQNVLNRKNAVGFAYTENPIYPNRIMPIDGSGLLPTFGFSLEF
ncbi:MAG: carboxypeptidase regulatory-like domain-containing protein [Gemmatimonadetes bacterium]|nr:carboxypeptidase regulatory-like domain-containing protein [Gemmatimonadota bacterium]MDA1104758.1 carboxypeptidase regulatory-like domain-containing protein [Gemmatimonadota bacterium]